jgi:recombination protein RecA
MLSTLSIRAQVETKIPSAFVPSQRPEYRAMPTGVLQIDAIAGGIGMSCLTELCGSNLASSGKTSVLTSLLARASQEHYCALVDASDSFDPASGEAAGANFSRLLWVRCGKSKSKLKPLEQAFKAADLLLQSGGFGLIVVDLSGIPERIVRRVPLTTWFRFSRVIEKLPAALVFIEQEPHATSCAGMVLYLTTSPAIETGKLFTRFNMEAEVIRARDRKPVRAVSPNFTLKTQWA